MPDYCTIFARSTDVGAVPERIRGLAPLAVEVAGPAEAWQRVVVRTPDATLTLNAMRRIGGGDPASKTLAGAINFFRRIRTTAVGPQERVLEHLRACQVIIGIVGDPGFSSDGLHERIIEDTAAALDGTIFNGSSMFDASGRLLLDSGGASDDRAA